MFEQEYKRANDRIHPRKDLLKEMEAKWAAESAQPAEAEQGKVVAFPRWVKYAGMAAGVLLCVGLGMGSVILFTRNGVMRTKNADAEPAAAPMMAESKVTENDEIIFTEAAYETADTGDMAAAGMLLDADLAAPAYEPPQGMHPAADEAEVENAIRHGELDRAAAEENGEGTVPQERPEAETEALTKPAATSAPIKTNKTTKAAADAPEAQVQYGPGELLRQNDLMAVYMPVSERVHVFQYADRKLTDVFSLTLRERGAQTKRVFWMGTELLALREREGSTELLRIDVTDWTAPKHLKNLTQSGAFLGAGEVNGRLAVLSRYRAGEEEPLPWVDDERMDYTDVLLDDQRRSDTFTVLTVYDPARDGFVSRMALLADGCGSAFGQNEVFLWAGSEGTSLYSFACGETGLDLIAEDSRPGTVLAATAGGGTCTLLMQSDDGVSLITLDRALKETANTTAAGAGAVRSSEVFEDGAVFLTDDALHVLTTAGDRKLALSGDGVHRLSADRLLVISSSGQLQLVAMDQEDLRVIASLSVKESLALLLEDPGRADYDEATGRLLFPAGQKVYQYRIDESGGSEPRGTSMAFSDHNETEQRELRCLLTEDRALILCKNSIVLCNENLVRQTASKF